MDAVESYKWNRTVPDDWVLSVDVWDDDKFVVSTSEGKVAMYSMQQLKNSSMIEIRAHETSINKVKKIDEHLLGTCSTDGIKIWDMRTFSVVNSYENDKKSNFLSLDSKNFSVAGGTELIGTDAELHIWDIRKSQSPIKSYIDSHHDDITDIKFHPNYQQYLMSGSTDGYVNIYDLAEEKEEDSLHQVINYASVHTCDFLTNDRISILSHMETLSFNQLNNTDYETVAEPLPTDFNDVRNMWDNCEYVIDVNVSGYITYGANSVQKLSLLPFNPRTESFGDDVINFPSAHGEEVVRDFKVYEESALSCGEDGTIKFWSLPKPIPLYSFNESANTGTNTSTNPSTTTTNASAKPSRSKHKKHKSKSTRYKPY